MSEQFIGRRILKKIKIMPSAYIMLLAMILSDRAELIMLYSLSAALHELGHIAAAKMLKIEISEIRFTYSGMRICTDEYMIPYKKEIIFALSGPLANIIVISIFSAVAALAHVTLEEVSGLCISFLFEGMYTCAGVFGFVALASLLQACINLLPVRTFDGGRIMYCFIALTLGERIAERVLDILSAFSAFILWVAALYLMLKISSGLGIYTFSACLFFGTMGKRPDKCENFIKNG